MNFPVFGCFAHCLFLLAFTFGLNSCGSRRDDDSLKKKSKVVSKDVAIAAESDESGIDAELKSNPSKDASIASDPSGDTPTPVIRAEPNSPAPKPALQPVVTASASCNGDLILVFAHVSEGDASAIIPAFAGCDKVVGALNSRKFPSGNTIEALTGGATVGAACNNTELTIVTVNSQTIFSIFNAAACLEIRNAINGLKI